LCEKKTWTEQHDAIASRTVLTDRARQRAFEQVGHHDRVAAQLGVSWHTIMTQVVDHGTPLVEDPDRLAGVSAVGVDETSFLRATSTRPHPLRHRRRRPDPGPPAAAAGRRTGPLRPGPGRLAERPRRGVAGRRSDRVAGPVPRLRHALSTHLPAATRVLDAFRIVKRVLLAVRFSRRR
jgi:hypothetical protein